MTQRELQDIFLEVCDLPPAERNRRLDELCVGDRELRARVERLLLHDAADDDCLGDAEIETGAPPVIRVLAGALGEAAELPESIGGFRILAKLGEGGMGTVFAAEQAHPHRRVALKMIRPGVMTEVLRRRFRAETELLGRLQHPGIAQIYEAGEIDRGNARQPYFAMEYVSGRDLRRYAREHDLGVPERLELVARVADAVHHAHSRGVVHRDLKPDNVLVSEEPAASFAGVPARFAGLGQPKILDFGVARATNSDQMLTTMHTHAGEILGTLTYMSPEQIAGRHEAVDARSDVYALGVILYELLAGKPPCDFRSLTIVEAARVAAEDDPLRLGSVDSACRGDIETIVAKALEKEPGLRYETAAELATDLRRHLANEPIAARRPSAAYQIRKFTRRHRGFVAGLAAAFAVLVAGVVTTSILAVRASRHARAAEAQKRLARAESYRFSLAAVEALGTDDPIQALRNLEDAPEEHRGWEWKLLEARLRSWAVRLVGDSASRRAHGLARDGEGRLLALLRRGGAIEIVDLLSDAVRHRVTVDGEPTIPVLSPDGSRLAIWFEPTKRLEVRDPATGSQLFGLPTGLSRRGAPSFDAAGRRLAVPSNGSLTVLSAEDGATRLRLEDSGRFEHAVFDPDGDGLVSVLSRPKNVDTLTYHRISAEGRIVATRDHLGSCYTLAVSPDGDTIAVGSRLRVFLLEADTLERVRDIHGFPGAVTALAFSPDGRFLAAAGHHIARIIDLTDRTMPISLPTVAVPTSILFDGDGTWLAVGSTAEVRAHDLRSTDPRILRGHGTFVYQVAFSPDGSRLASADFDDRVILWDPATGERLATGETERGRTALQFTRDGSKLVVSTRVEGRLCRTWNPLTGRHGTVDLGDESLTGLADDYETWDGYQECRKVQSRDGRIRLVHMGRWPLEVIENGRELDRLGIGRTDRVQGTALSPDGKRIVTGHTGGTVSLWDLSTGREIAHAGGHTGTVFSVEFHPDGSRIVSGGNAGLVIVRDPETLLPLVSLRGHQSYIHDLDFSPDGRMLASASGDGTVRIWDTTPHLERPRPSKR